MAGKKKMPLPIKFQSPKSTKMKKGILSLLAWSLPFLLLAQRFDGAYYDSGMAQRDKDYKGIIWVTGLSWEQIKQKAKVENKYIFIDAYTTWCGPCKMMDKNVYSNDTVGDFFNKHYIAVKVQMDITDKDEQSIKDWYDDAIVIRTEFLVKAFPSLIFLSPNGEIIQIEEGYRPVQKFVSIAKETISPGKEYNDPYKEYKVLVNEYKQGVKRYNMMPYMIKMASKVQNTELAKEIFKEHLNYASRLNKEERYTKENIEAWSLFTFKIESKALQFFIKDGKKIDQVMGYKGYATDIVDKMIQARIVDSFFKMQKGETTLITGKKVPNKEVMFIWLPIRNDKKIEPDFVEADWKKLNKMIRKSFNNNYTKRNLLTAKMRWYRQHQNMVGLAKTTFKRLDKFPPERFDASTVHTINELNWNIFLYVNDKTLLSKAAKWARKIIPESQNNTGYIDTYANLLYKLGQVDDALQWEEMAFNTTIFETEKIGFRNVIVKMKKGEPTYLEEGAIWIKEQ